MADHELGLRALAMQKGARVERARTKGRWCIFLAGSDEPARNGYWSSFTPKEPKAFLKTLPDQD